MKKVLLSLFLVLVISFSLCCGFRNEEEYVLESARIKMIGARIITINDVEVKMVAWEEKHKIAPKPFDSNAKSMFWYLYPVEKITDDFEDKIIKMTYRIMRLDKPPIVYVTNIEVIN